MSLIQPHMREILRGHGLSEEEIDARFTMFNHYPLAQMGEDARTATAGRGEAHAKQLVEAIAAQIQHYLSDRCPT